MLLYCATGQETTGSLDGGYDRCHLFYLVSFIYLNESLNCLLNILLFDRRKKERLLGLATSRMGGYTENEGRGLRSILNNTGVLLFERLEGVIETQCGG